MEKDQLIEEIRKIRDAHAKQFNYDLHEICLDMKKIEKEYGYKVVSFPAKRIVKTTS